MVRFTGARLLLLPLILSLTKDERDPLMDSSFDGLTMSSPGAGGGG